MTIPPYTADSLLANNNTAAVLNNNFSFLNSNMQLCEAASHVGMASGLLDIFSRAAAQLRDKTLKPAAVDLSFGSAGRALVHGSPIAPSSVPLFDTMDFVPSSNSFNFLSTTYPLMSPRLPTSVSSSSSDQYHRNPMPSSMSATQYRSTVSSMGFSPQDMAPCVSSAKVDNTKSPQSEPDSYSHLHLTGYNFTSSDTLQANLELFEASTSGHSSFAPPVRRMNCVDSFSVAVSAPSGATGGEIRLMDSTNLLSKQDPALFTADGDPNDLSHNNKRRNSYIFRKTQQKRMVCVPINESGKHKGDPPPPDEWAWRKYGQKPIKGSPYPRGYYRCSSSKGCSARKQVERSRSDPTVVMVTYTSEHNHPWPATSSSPGGPGSSTCRPSSANVPTSSSSSSKCSSCSFSAGRGGTGQESSLQEGQANTGSLFSSIINSVSVVDEHLLHHQQQVASSLSFVIQDDEESFRLQRDVNLFLSKTNADLDDVFDDLGELPELSAIFSKEYQRAAPGSN